uniref:TAF6 n=1 Tax=Arundo donax TaxID=35708 RepID=A0A0A9F3K4_ARUDO
MRYNCCVKRGFGQRSFDNLFEVYLPIIKIEEILMSHSSLKPQWITRSKSIYRLTLHS